MRVRWSPAPPSDPARILRRFIGGTPGLPSLFFSQAGALAVGVTDRAYLQGQQDAIVHLLGGLTEAERAAAVRRCINELHALETGGRPAPPTGWRGLIDSGDHAPTLGLATLRPPQLAIDGKPPVQQPNDGAEQSLSIDDVASEIASAALHARASLSAGIPSLDVPDGTEAGPVADAAPVAAGAVADSKSKAKRGKSPTKSKSKTKAAAAAQELPASAATAPTPAAAAPAPAAKPAAAARPALESVGAAPVELETVGPHGMLRPTHRQDGAAVASTLYRGAATLLAQTQPSHALLTALCWVPIRLFRIDAVREAIRLWQWLIGTHGLGTHGGVAARAGSNPT